MRKRTLTAGLLALALLAAPGLARAHVSIGIGLPFFGFGVVAPAPVVVVPPVYAPPPAYYYPPPVAYGPPGYYGYGGVAVWGRPYHDGWRHGWYRHGRHW